LTAARDLVGRTVILPPRANFLRRLPDDVCSVPLVDPTITRTLVVAFPRAKVRNAQATAFIELLRAGTRE